MKDIDASLREGSQSLATELPDLDLFRGERAWRALIERYADGRQPCNCGGAYYTPCGEAWVTGSNKKITNYPICKHGCSANLIDAKHEIAQRVLAELGAVRSEAKPASETRGTNQSEQKKGPTS